MPIEEGTGGSTTPTPTTTTVSSPPPEPSGPEALSNGLTFPVPGGTFSNDWLAPRDGGERQHHGTDIFAPTGTAVLAAVGGEVIKAGDDGGAGGIRVTIRGDDGNIYYYAHMADFTVKVGATIAAGTRIGSVGTSGNAAGTPPHLHFSASTGGADDGSINSFMLLSGSSIEDSIAAASTPGTATGDANERESSSVTAANVGELTDEERQELQAEFGWAAYLIDAVPEVGELVIKASREEWETERLLNALMGTEWWRETESSVREWQTFSLTDPATAADVVGQTKLTMKMAASRMGITISDEALSALAETSLRLGWVARENPDVLGVEAQQALASHIDHSNLQPGTVTAQGDDLRRLAASYMLPMSESTVNGWVDRIINGEATVEGFQSMLQRQAAGKYTTFADLINQGVTPEDIFDSYKEQAARTLEMDVDQIDLLGDPRFSAALETVGSDGKPRAMTLSEWQRHLRGMPEWKQTDNAKALALPLARRVATMFGKGA